MFFDEDGSKEGGGRKRGESRGEGFMPRKPFSYLSIAASPFFKFFFPSWFLLEFFVVASMKNLGGLVYVLSIFFGSLIDFNVGLSLLGCCQTLCCRYLGLPWLQEVCRWWSLPPCVCTMYFFSLLIFWTWKSVIHKVFSHRTAAGATTRTSIRRLRELNE